MSSIWPFMFLREEFGLKALSSSCLGNYSSSKERTKDRKEMTEKEQQQQQEEEQHKKGWLFVWGGFKYYSCSIVGGWFNTKEHGIVSGESIVTPLVCSPRGGHSKAVGVLSGWHQACPLACHFGLVETVAPSSACV